MLTGLETLAIESISTTIGKCSVNTVSLSKSTATSTTRSDPNLKPSEISIFNQTLSCQHQGMFQCASTKNNQTTTCVSYSKLCDGENDCGDWSDELGCKSGCGRVADVDLLDYLQKNDKINNPESMENTRLQLNPTGYAAKCLWRFNRDEVKDARNNLQVNNPDNEQNIQGIIFTVKWTKSNRNMTSDVDNKQRISNTINSFFKGNKYIKLTAPEACYLDIHEGYNRNEGKALTRIRFKEDQFTRQYFVQTLTASIQLATYYEKIQSVESNVYLMKAIGENLEISYKISKKSECDLVCSDGKCVKNNFKCDGVPACDDESDERDCFRILDQMNGKEITSSFAIKQSKSEADHPILTQYCYKNKAWLPVCLDNKESLNKMEDIANKACYHMGFWKAASYSTLRLLSSQQKNGPFSVFSSKGNAVHNVVFECQQILTLICEPFPCGEQLHDPTDVSLLSSMSIDPSTQTQSLASNARLRIVGGQKAKPKQWPWAISLQHNNKHNCGGTMISDRHVMTAAHCFDYNDPKDHTVMIGVIRTEKGGAIARGVKRGILHEMYNPTINIPDYDIAILELDQRVVIDSYNFMPVCLPKFSSPAKPGDVCYIAGWGKQNDQFGSFPEQLYDVSTPILPNDKCLQGEYLKPEYRRQGIPITDRQLCGGLLWSGGFGFCHGDSGGGLYCQDQSKRLHENSWVLHGVVSWSVGCASVDKPDVYTRTRKFIDWAESITRIHYAPNPGLGLDPINKKDIFGLRTPPPANIGPGLGAKNITCGGKFTVYEKGQNIISNPGWPGMFPADVECTWQIQAPKAHTVKINFLFFNLLSDKMVTKVSIMESDIHGKKIMKIGVFSGTSVPKKIHSTRQMMTIRFITKGPVIWKPTNGFMFEYFFENTRQNAITSIFKQENMPCDFQYDKRMDLISFNMEPNYLLPCTLTINPGDFKPGNESIIIKFYDVELGSYYENLQIKNTKETINIEGHNVVNKKRNITSHEPTKLIFNSQLGYESTANFRFSYSTVMRKPDMEESSQKALEDPTATGSEIKSTAVFEQLIAETSCKSTIEENELEKITVINSPNHPYTYPRQANCYWRLETKNKNQQIELSFKIFQVEFSSKCQYDGLKVITRKDLQTLEKEDKSRYDKYKPRDWKGVITFCGKTVPPTVKTEGPVAYLGFYSDEFQGFEGFKIFARAIDKEPTGEEDPNSADRKELFNCDFESGLCGMRQISQAQSKFRWLKNHDYTPSQATGPPYDRSMSGHYLYTEATEIRPGTKAKIFTPVFQIETDNQHRKEFGRQNPTFCLSFFYDMFGESMGSLKIYLHTEETHGMEDGKGILIWTRSGEQRSQTDLPWSTEAAIEFIPTSSFFIEFQGIRGIEYKSDMAIDEIILLQGKCPKCHLVEGLAQCGTKTNECYPSELRCDGYKDCLEGEDEIDCPKRGHKEDIQDNGPNQINLLENSSQSLNSTEMVSPNSASLEITIDDETNEKHFCQTFQGIHTKESKDYFTDFSDSNLCNHKAECFGGYDEMNCVENNQENKCGKLPSEDFDLRKFQHTPLNITQWPNLATILVKDQFACLGSLIGVDQYNAWFLVATSCTVRFYEHPMHMLEEKYSYGKTICGDQKPNQSRKARNAQSAKLLNVVSAETSENSFSTLAEVIQHKSGLISILKFDVIYHELNGFAYDDSMINQFDFDHISWEDESAIEQGLLSLEVDGEPMTMEPESHSNLLETSIPQDFEDLTTQGIEDSTIADDPLFWG